MCLLGAITSVVTASVANTPYYGQLQDRSTIALHFFKCEIFIQKVMTRAVYK